MEVIYAAAKDGISRFCLRGLIKQGGNEMQYTTLGQTGIRVSKLGLGGAPLGGDFGATTDEEIERVVHTALDSGI
ncbi:hypothetical protein K0U00_42465, partial [Paenibacillus sepulcri]|nr:hypothetical protein [Paenibacillus sepulcri]